MGVRKSNRSEVVSCMHTMMVADADVCISAGAAARATNSLRFNRCASSIGVPQSLSRRGRRALRRRERKLAGEERQHLGLEALGHAVDMIAVVFLVLAGNAETLQRAIELLVRREQGVAGADVDADGAVQL